MNNPTFKIISLAIVSFAHHCLCHYHKQCYSADQLLVCSDWLRIRVNVWFWLISKVKLHFEYYKMSYKHSMQLFH
jgi:hypothetical protein